MAFHWIKSHLENRSVFRASLGLNENPKLKLKEKRRGVNKKKIHQKISQKNLKSSSSAITKHSRNCLCSLIKLSAIRWCLVSRDHSPAQSSRSTRKHLFVASQSAQAAPTEHHRNRLFAHFFRSRLIAITWNQLIYLIKTNYLSPWATATASHGLS